MTTGRDVQLSKSLSWILRHRAQKEHIPISSEGWILVNTILEHRNFKGFTLNDIKKVVQTNDKQRFAVRQNSEGLYEIRANQGHSIQEISVELRAITKATELREVIHGTFTKNWHSIKNEGLSRVKRNHIHFAQGLPNSPNIKSGIRPNAQVLIYIDLEKALTDGLKFFLSENGVILSPGDRNGFIAPQYFLKVVTPEGEPL